MQQKRTMNAMNPVLWISLFVRTRITADKITIDLHPGLQCPVVFKEQRRI